MERDSKGRIRIPEKGERSILYKTQDYLKKKLHEFLFLVPNAHTMTQAEMCEKMERK
jgi:hypothetical protein